MFKHIYIAYRTHFIPPFLPATYKHTITRNSINSRTSPSLYYGNFPLTGQDTYNFRVIRLTIK